MPLSAKTYKLLAINTPLGTFVPNFCLWGSSRQAAFLPILLEQYLGTSAIMSSRCKYRKAFEKLKDAVAGATELHLPDMDAERVLKLDVSDVACGGSSLQRIRVSDNPLRWEMQLIAYTHHEFNSIAIN